MSAASQMPSSVNRITAAASPKMMVSGIPMTSRRPGTNASRRQAVLLIALASLNKTTARVISKRTVTASEFGSASIMPSPSDPMINPAVTKIIGPVMAVVLSRRENSAYTANRAPRAKSQKVTASR